MSRAGTPGAACAGLALAVLLAACDLGPLGGTSLEGERADSFPKDWSFLEPRYFVAIETQAGALLPSAQSWFVVRDGVLWLHAMSTASLERSWVRRLRDESPGITIEANERLYAARAVHVTDPQAIEPLLPALLRKYHGVETPRARFAARSERFPETQIRHAFFRIEPPEDPAP